MNECLYYEVLCCACGVVCENDEDCVVILYLVKIASGSGWSSGLSKFMEFGFSR